MLTTSCPDSVSWIDHVNIGLVSAVSLTRAVDFTVLFDVVASVHMPLSLPLKLYIMANVVDVLMILKLYQIVKLSVIMI